MGPSRGRCGRTEGRIKKQTTDLESGHHSAIFGTLQLFLTLPRIKLNFLQPIHLQWDLLGGAVAERKVRSGNRQQIWTQGAILQFLIPPTSLPDHPNPNYRQPILTSTLLDVARTPIT